MSPLSIAAMTGVPDKAEESVRSGWGAIFGCGWRRDAKVGHLRKGIVLPVRGKSPSISLANRFLLRSHSFSDFRLRTTDVYAVHDAP